MYIPVAPLEELDFRLFISIWSRNANGELCLIVSSLLQLIAGSGATEEADDKEHAGGVAEIDLAKAGDGYTEGIPGPITRLFVIANRGIANLVQDLILVRAIVF